MKANNKWIMNVFVGVMLIYQAWRVYDYMSNGLQGVDEFTTFIVSMAFLTFTEVGLLVWLHIGQPQATTSKQSGVAGTMIWTDYAGSMILGLADLAVHNKIYDVDLSLFDPILFFAPWLVVAANVAGYIAYHGWDADMELEKADKALEYEEHALLIAGKRASIKDLQRDKKILSEKLKPGYIRRVIDNANGRSARELGKQADALLPPPAPPVTAFASEAEVIEELKPAEPVSDNGKQAKLRQVK